MNAERFSAMLDYWARWRVIPERSMYYKKHNMIHKLKESMPSDQCPRCGGQKKVKLPGIGKVKCPRCYGSGKVGRADTGSKISPALIPATSHPLDDDHMEAMERAFAQDCSQAEQDAIEAEVYMHGDASMKAEKLGISRPAYYTRVSRGLDKMRQALDSM